MAQALGGIANKFEQKRDEYLANHSDKFYISTDPYYSTVGFRWRIDLNSEFEVNGVRKVIATLIKQEQEFFSYGLRDDVTEFGLGNRGATDKDTNVIVKNKTNQEDFVIEGLSAHCVGHRIVCVIPGHRQSEISGDMRQILTGEVVVHDPGAVVLPPEVSSPMLLEQGLFHHLSKSVSLAPTWNRRVEDHIGLLRLLPEGGANSYLRSNGEPTHHNFYRVPEGWEWLREGSPEDTMFSMSAKVDTPVSAILSIPPFMAGNEKGDVIWPVEIWTLIQVQLHGRSFYLRSKNA